MILWRYKRMKDGSRESSIRALEFADAGEISDWANEALCWMTAQGILRGTGNNRLIPRGTATQAQFATMLMRYDSLA